MAHDGYAAALTARGYKILHEHSDKATFSDRKSVRTIIYDADMVEVLRIEQNWNGKGGQSLSQIYQKACIDLGIFKKGEESDEPQIGLRVRIRNEGNACHEAVEYYHPSFGVASLTRYQGGGKHFMSPIETRGGMCLRFHTATLTQDKSLGTDRVFAERVIFEVDFSFTQFAELITSAGVGAGVPCTLKHFDGVSHEWCPLPHAEERLEDLAKAKMEEAVIELRSMVKELNAEMSGAGGLAAGRKKEIWEKITRALSDIDGKPQWLLRVWREHVDETLTHAKGEFAHWAQGYVQNAGMEALQGKGPDALMGKNDDLDP